jgi:alpha-L-arabinofuranosidase
MKLCVLYLLLLLFMFSCRKTSSNQLPWNMSKTVLLPDGQVFPFWEDQTIYTRVYYVDQKHPQASDQNPGTKDSPFLTINHAAKVLKPGEKVIVKKGIYRENVQPARGGDSQKSMICYEASSNAEVIISGSEVLQQKWIKSTTPYKPSMPFSHKIWMTSVPHSYFKEPNPFLIQNADEYEMKIMPWAKSWTNRVPYTLVRGLIFQDGMRMTQLCAYEDIVKLPGSYWVDTTDNDDNTFRIHIYPFLGKDPNTQLMEITTRQSPFNPKVKGINYIRVRGFIFEQVGNGFPLSAKGAFSTFGGSNWIIEDNIFRKINSVAIEIGAVTDRHIEKELNDENRKEFETVSGKHIVRNNILYDCGTGGIQGLINTESLVENNHLFNIGWQEAEFYWETSAIKLHMTHDCLIRGNHIHDIAAAMGIWLDAYNLNSRVTQNLLYNVSCNYGAIFIEISSKPNLVDHNLVWNCGRNGIYQHDVDSLFIVHNIVGQSKENGIMMRSEKGRQKMNGEFTTARYNIVLNNILINNAFPFSYSDTLNISDKNIIATSEAEDAFDWDRWHKKGFDKNSKSINIKASFNPINLVFKMKTIGVLPQTEKLHFINEDMIGRKYDKGDIKPGGLKNGGNETIKLGHYFNNKINL